MKHRLLLVLFTLCRLMQPEFASAEILFRENKGQWESPVRYKAEVRNGAIFFEQSQITFHLFDPRDILRIKGDHHKLEHYKPDVDHRLHFHAFRMKFVNAATQEVKGSEAISEYFNYFLGSDKSKWASKVKAFRQLQYQQLLAGIDLKVSSQKGALKYVYEVKAGADASAICVEFEGVDGVTIDKEGALLLKTSVGDVADLAPYAYQITDGKEVKVPCHYFLNEAGQLQYRFPKGYDRSRTLYIDPTLVFSTYSGSTADNFGYSATYDQNGNAFAAGSVFGVGYPTTVGAYMVNYLGGPTIFFSTGGQYPGDDIGITKYSADGTQRIFSTYLGGYGQDLPHSLIANSANELYILGTTDASNFPTSANAFDNSFNGGNDPGVFDGIAAHYANGSDIFISRLSADGSQLLASTYVGGADNDGLNYRAGQSYATPGFTRHNYADEVRGEIDLDENGNVYVASCTRSADFPRTSGAFQQVPGGNMDACVFEMDAGLSTMLWSTTFGGSDDDAAYSVSIDDADNLYVAGGTLSVDYPALPGAFQTSFGGGEADGFIAHISGDGTQLMHSTYYGFGDYDQNYFVELDKAGYVYVLGQADNAGTQFIHNALYNTPNGGEFVSKFRFTLDSLVWSTSFGRGLGVTDISPTAFLVDVCNSVYACGWGSQGVNNIVGGTGGTTGMDVTPDAYKLTTDGQDFYLIVLKDDASQLTYATFMGGNISEEHVDGGTSRFDKKGFVYQSVCAGCGSNDDFPTTSGAVSNTNNSNNCNNAIFKFNLDLPVCLADFSSPNACTNIPVLFTNESTLVGTATAQWTFGDGGTSTLFNPSHNYTLPGVYDVTLIVTDAGSCNSSDTITQQILVIGGQGSSVLPSDTVCEGGSTQIGIPPGSDTAVTYLWTPSFLLSSNTVSNPVATPAQTTTYQLLVNNGVCVDTFFQTVVVFTDSLTLSGSPVLCPGDTLTLTVANAQANQTLSYSWQPTAQIISGGNTASPTVSPNANTTYTVTVTNQLGCSYTDSISINVISSLPDVNAFADPDTITFGDTTQLTTTVNSNVTSLIWEMDSTLSSITIADPLAFPTATHSYIVTVADNNGCSKTDTVTVYVVRTPCSGQNIFIPNAFSPNGDGHNDVFYVRGYNISNFHVMIYDRWGQQVYESTDMNAGWNGTFKGKLLDPAVFGYHVEGTCDGGEQFELNGNLSILR